VRAAAVEDFLSDLKAHGSADLSAVMTTLNDAGLCRETLEHWTQNQWVVVARSMPLVALRGERFSHDLTLREFCGEALLEAPLEGEAEAPASSPTEE
jgi:hypothetical protein